jgi:EAL domain-containing protein (putative c-di-GMP-specific phosphodiesterase class I)
MLSPQLLPKGIAHTSGVAQLIASQQLSAYYQSIVRLSDGAVVGHEALLRGPAGTPFEQPHSLFSQALREGISIELEHVAAHLGITAYATAPRNNLLFVNYSAPAIQSLLSSHQDRLVSNLMVAVAHPLVVEVTEQSEIASLQQFGCDALSRGCHVTIKCSRPIMAQSGIRKLLSIGRNGTGANKC